MKKSNFPGLIAIIGSGSWATALAKLMLVSNEQTVWYMRSDERISDFRALGHNPAYLSEVEFDTSRIVFSSDINEVCRMADTLLLAVPSPYFKSLMSNITEDVSGKWVVNAIKGIVPDENILITTYLTKYHGIDLSRQLVVSGPCHAEEVALERLSCLTVASANRHLAECFAGRLASKHIITVQSTDVEGIEYCGVMKNVYALCAGMLYGLGYGDNFLAAFIANCIREMQRFVDVACPNAERNICDSVYLGDLLVTCYSRFSRNHSLGEMIGGGLSVKSAIGKMNMVAEGYYATRCIRQIYEKYQVRMPILDAAYGILYENRPPRSTISSLALGLK